VIVLMELQISEHEMLKILWFVAVPEILIIIQPLEHFLPKDASVTF
jgi:hypothetical protein